jgi:hypothetical protein
MLRAFIGTKQSIQLRKRRRANDDKQVRHDTSDFWLSHQARLVTCYLRKDGTPIIAQHVQDATKK